MTTTLTFDGKVGYRESEEKWCLRILIDVICHFFMLKEFNRMQNVL